MPQPSLRSAFEVAVADGKFRFDGFRPDATREEVLDRVIASFDACQLQAVLAELALQVAAEIHAKAAPLLRLAPRQQLAHGKHVVWIDDDGILEVALLSERDGDDDYAALWNPPPERIAPDTP